MSRPERAAANEAMFRDVNERLDELGDALELAEEAFLCECSRPDCAVRISMARDLYERIRQGARRFFVVPDHEDPAIERVVATHPGFLVVEKLGTAGEVADETEPLRD